MTLNRDQMLVEMGISPLWVEREPGTHLRSFAKTPQLEQPAIIQPVTPLVSSVVAEPEQQRTVPIAPFSSPEPNATVHSENWPKLAEQVATCKACPLSQHRKQAVLGVGDQHPDWLFVGEAPGAEEDTQGEPFVGQNGKLLDNMLAALDINRHSKVYITNAVKCRPPGNRTPESAEVVACQTHLQQQIALLKPKVIVLLGKVAAGSLLKDDKTLAAMRGIRFEYAGIPVVVTYHPAYLLRNLPDKAKAWEDLVFARKLLSQQPSQKPEGELPF